MTWTERMAFTASTPPPTGLARMARTIAGRRAQVRGVRRLRGGVDASTHAIRVEPLGWVVLKRSWTPDPRSLSDEFHLLGVATRARVATPEPIALDAQGEWFDRPAIVMSLVAGSGRIGSLGPSGPWVSSLADALAAIHDVPLEGTLPTAVHAPHAGIVWRPADPSKLRRTPRVAALLDVVHDAPTVDTPDVLLHHDFHHGNVLWRRGTVAGVIDWNEARVGPAVCDVAYCSVDLAMTHGITASEQFCAAYQTRTGGTLADLHRWQALWTLNDMRWVHYWVGGFAAAGQAHLTLDVLRRRLRRFAAHLLTGAP